MLGYSFWPADASASGIAKLTINTCRVIDWSSDFTEECFAATFAQSVGERAEHAINLVIDARIPGLVAVLIEISVDFKVEVVQGSVGVLDVFQERIGIGGELSSARIGSAYGQMVSRSLPTSRPFLSSPGRRILCDVAPALRIALTHD